MTPTAKDQRFILVNRSVWMKEMADFLREAYPHQKVTQKELPYCGVKIAATFDKKVRLILPLWGVERTLKNDKSIRMLGIQYHDMRDTVVDMGRTLMDYGYVKERKPKA